MYRMTCRNVIATLAGSSATLLGPAILSAQDAFQPDWGDTPTTGMIQYVAVHHRTPSQVANANDQDGTVQNPNYFVVNLLCPHRGKAVGITGNADVPFACTNRGSRHSSNFDVSGKTVSGASDDKSLKIPDYTLTVGDTIVGQLA